MSLQLPCLPLTSMRIIISLYMAVMEKLSTLATYISSSDLLPQLRRKCLTSYQFTASVEECRASQGHRGDGPHPYWAPLYIAFCPRPLISVEVFINYVHELQKEIIFELDHPLFFVKDR